MERRFENGEFVHRAYLGFLSVGSTIALSMQTCSEDVRQDLDDYLRMHEGGACSRETLTTLYALQDGITRDAAARAARRGGVGFQDVLETVSMIAGVQKEGRGPRITIISGRSCLKLRSPYIKGVRAADDQPRLLWCNPANAANETPDGGFVFDLPDHFPGTIIGVAFTIDPEFLRSIVS